MNNLRFKTPMIVFLLIALLSSSLVVPSSRTAAQGSSASGAEAQTTLGSNIPSIGTASEELASDQIGIYGWTREDFLAKHAELWDQGWRLHLLEVFVLNGLELYSAVWQPSTSGEVGVYGWTREDFLAKHAELWGQGWRLHLLDVFVVNGLELYAAVWRPSTSSEVGVYGWTRGDFLNKHEELRGQGWRLHLLDVFVVNGLELYSAVWLPIDKPAPKTDNGFRPNPDGYSFQNYGGVNEADLTVDDLRPIFGDSAVCSSQAFGICLYNPAAVQWRNLWNQVMNGGHCYGMAVTSSRFFAGVDQPATFQANAVNTFDLQLADARRNIASYFVRQGANPVAANLQSSLRQTPAQILEQIRNSFDSPSDALTIAIFGPGGGHAVTPYRVEDRGNGVFWVMVYDNNHPTDANRHVEVNITNNTWRYDLGWITWRGNATTHSFGVVPYALNNAIMACPWCSGNSGTLVSNEFSQILAIGNAKVLVIDETGRRFGTVGNDFVEEIPDAYQTVLMTGLPVPSPAIYNIPVIGTHTLLLNSGVITQPTSMTVSQFGPDYAVTIDGITLNPAQQDQLQITADGKQVAYQASEQKTVTMTIALANLPSLSTASHNATAATESYAFELSGADVGANQVLLAAVDSASGTFSFRNAEANGGAYDLVIERTDDLGQRIFSYDAIVIAAGDTHMINYSLWGRTTNGLAPVTIQVDQGSDGTVDSTIYLQNQANKLYLPLITR